MKKFYTLTSEPDSCQDSSQEPVQPRLSTIEFIRSFARACQSVASDDIPPALSAVVLN